MRTFEASNITIFHENITFFRFSPYGKLNILDRLKIFTLNLKFFVIAGVLLAILCVESNQAEAQSFSEDAKWWSMPLPKLNCGNSFPTDRPVEPLELKVKLTRKPWPEEYEINFVTYYAAQVARTAAGIDVENFKKFILKVAEDKIYTEPDMSTVWSPIYIQSNIILLTAHYITIMDETGNLTNGERSKLISWIKPMLKWQVGNNKNGSADSQAASGSALIAWGSVVGDTQLMSKGFKRYKKGLDFALRNVGSLKRHPDHEELPLDVLSLYDEYNNNISHVVQGAAVLKNLGVDVYNIEIDGSDLHDAINWWAGVVWSRRTDPTNDPSGFTGYSRRGLNDNLGWIPIYISRFPDAAEAELMRVMARQVSKGRRPMFEATAIGGATDCLWGYAG